MQRDQQAGKIRKPGRTALVIAVAVVVVLALGYFLTNALVANGEHAGERCSAPPASGSQPLPPGAQLQDYQGHLFTLTVTCSYKTPDGTVIEKEKDLF